MIKSAEIVQMEACKSLYQLRTSDVLSLLVLRDFTAMSTRAPVAVSHKFNPSGREERVHPLYHRGFHRHIVIAF